MSKVDRLSHIIEIYLQGELELDTAVAELMHVYIERGWRFSLIETECEPGFRDAMHALANQVDLEALAQRESTGKAVSIYPPIVIH
jgi:hypothetical protein